MVENYNKEMKKGFTLVVSVFALQLLSPLMFLGCNPCGPFEPEDYLLQGINTSVQRIASISETDNNVDIYALEDFAVQVEARYDSLGFEIENILMLAMEESENSFDYGFQSVQACSPPGPEFSDELSDIIITSNVDYSPQYQKGQNLKELLSVNYAYYPNHYLANRIDVPTYLNLGNPLNFEGLFFTFNQPPDESRIHNFSIKYVLKSGKVYESNIQNVLIKK